jgi:Flp pilus assembly protein TadG
MFGGLPHCELANFSKSARSATRNVGSLLFDTRGSAILEFAIALPLLVLFVVGIYDFSGALNQKQKIEQAAQEGAIVAGSQPTSDIQTTNASPNSLQAVVAAVFNSLAGNGVLPNANQGTCIPPGTVGAVNGLTWTYTISGCNSAHSANNDLTVVINRASVSSAPPSVVCTVVTVSYPFYWQSYGVIQSIIPTSYTLVTESATIHNQM